MPYIDKNGRPILFEETDYFNGIKKALIYYPVKAKRISGVPVTPTPTTTLTPTPTPTITTTPTLTPTPTSSPIPFDSDAAAYLADVITSGGTTDSTISAATNTLFTSLKSAGLYSKMKAMYPYIGGTSSSHSINALLNKTYDIDWFGGVSHSVSGVTGDGINGYGNTNYTQLDWNFDDISMGIYQITDNTPLDSNENIIGVNAATGNLWPRVFIQSNFNGTDWRYVNGEDRINGTNSGNIKGNYITTRTTGSTDTFLYYNDTLVLSAATDAYVEGATPRDVYVLNLNLNNSPTYYANQTISFAFMGDGLTSGEVSTLDGIINTFQTSLGRNTY